MAVNNISALVLFTVCVGLIVIVAYIDHTTNNKSGNAHVMSVRESVTHFGSHDIYYNMAKVVQERNNMSKELNLRQQRLLQKECESQKGEISSTGGWCARTSKENGGQHKTDNKLIPVLAKFLTGKKVGSFGDGPGRYKQLLTETKLLHTYDAYDGAPFSEKTSEGRVSYLDLTLPQYGLPLYDWIISLEVAEHIPAKYEKIYIDNIIRHAKEGIILSWAVPGQSGHSHVNNRPFEYVKSLFESHGFSHDETSSTLLKKAATLDWLKKNTNVYRRKDMSKVEMLETFYT